MPIYTFKCVECNHEFEKLVPRGREVYCPECGNHTKIMWSVPSAPQWGPGVRNF
jgi:putative FmdB family regulatory protein